MAAQVARALSPSYDYEAACTPQCDAIADCVEEAGAEAPAGRVSLRLWKGASPVAKRRLRLGCEPEYRAWLDCRE